MQQNEIERKFLITRLPDNLLATASATRIRQGYLLSESARELRLRQRGEQFWITEKQGRGLQRLEQEVPLDKLLFQMLWPLTAGRRLEKTRHLLPQADLVLEFDLFDGNLSPLILLEVEFTSEAASRNFTPPPYVALEVTEDPAFKNASLAIDGLPDSFVRLHKSAEPTPGKEQDERE
jgi:CYTH domain-containing protein